MSIVTERLGFFQVNHGEASDLKDPQDSGVLMKLFMFIV